MNFKLVAEQEWRGLRKADEKIASVKEQINLFCLEMNDVFRRAKGVGVDILTFHKPTDSRSSLDIKSPFGDARVRIDWRSDAEGIRAKWIFERKQFDSFDSIFWEPIAVAFAESGNYPYVDNAGMKQILPVGDQFDDNRVVKLYAFGAQILYSIINGPLPV